MTKLEKIEKSLKDGNTLLIRAGEGHKNLTKQYKKLVAELKDLGVNPKEEEKYLETLNAEITEKIEELNNLLPNDIIEKYKEYDFSADNVEVPDFEDLDNSKF